MRARYPDREGYVDRDGVSIFYEVYENDRPTVVLVPTTTILNSRQWKAQIHFFSRHYRVVTFDGRGNGKSAKPGDVDAYRTPRLVEDIVAVMDATGTERAVLVALCHAVPWIIELATTDPDRVSALVALSPHVDGISPPHDHWVEAWQRWDQVLDHYEGWAMANKHYWLNAYRTWIEFFFTELIPEPHSTKAHEDAVSWGLGTTGQARVLELAARKMDARTDEEMVAMCRSVTHPVLVIHGTDDRCQPIARGHALADLTGGIMVEIKGGGHALMGREPVKFNHIVKQFIDQMGGTVHA